MKKEILFLILLVFSIFSITYFSHLAIAETVDDAIQTQTGFNPENIPNPTNIEDIKTKYLQREWNQIIDKNAIAEPIQRFLISINPFLKAVLGVEYALSWAFFFAIVIWISLFVFLQPIAEVLFKGKLFGILGAFIVASLIGLSGTIKRAVDMLTFVINNTWILWISVVVAIVITIILHRLGISFEQKIKQSKEAATKEQAERDRQILRTDAKVTKKDLESYKDKS
ncbi:hypothetical protein J4217_00295 [Candidatus Pacearchaeota archaeon]|nr:hypothetical protein [Candidatus Pacearchaeota archaeon]